MDIGFWLAVAGIVLAVAGIVFTVWYGRRALPPKRELQWTSTTTELLAAETLDDEVEVSIAGDRVDEPFLTRLTILNSGKTDLDSQAFDQARPIKFEVDGAQKCYLLKGKGTTAPVVLDADALLFGPDLLSAGATWTASLLTNGPAELRLREKYLPNFPLLRYVESAQLRARTRTLFLYSLLATTVIVSVVALIISANMVAAPPPLAKVNYGQSSFPIPGGDTRTVVLTGQVSGLAEGHSLWIAVESSMLPGLYNLVSKSPVTEHDGDWSVTDELPASSTKFVLTFRAVDASADCVAQLPGFFGDAGQLTSTALPGGCAVVSVLVAE